MDEPQTGVLVPADKTLAKMTRSVDTKLAKFEKMLGQAQTQAVEIGQELIAIRSYIQDNAIEGGFDGWLRTSFRWSRTQAYRLIDAGEQFGDCPNLGHYDTSALYLLAAAGTPETAKDEAEKIAEQGGSVDHATASEIVERHRAISEATSPASTTEDEAAKPDTKPSRSRGRRPTPLMWEYRCHNSGFYVTITGTADPVAAREALTEALSRIESDIREHNTVAVMPPDAAFTSLLDDNDDDLEADEEGNVVRCPTRTMR